MKSSRSKIFALLIGIATCMAQGLAVADLYIGAGAYRATASLDNLDESDTTSGFQVGYVIIDSVFILSAELGRYDLGSFSDGGTEFEAQATTLAGVLSLALGPFVEIYAKTGLATTDAKVNGSSDDKSEAFTGFGASFDILDTVDLYAEYLDFDTAADTNLLGAGVRLQF